MTIGFVADENFNRRIITGMQRRSDHLDIVRIQDVGLRTADDPAVLEWAAAQGRVLLTHDRATMPGYALARVAAGQPMAGVFVVPATMPIGNAIVQLTMVAQASLDGEWDGQVRYLPLR